MSRRVSLLQRCYQRIQCVALVTASAHAREEDRSKANFVGKHLEDLCDLLGKLSAGQDDERTRSREASFQPFLLFFFELLHERQDVRQGLSRPRLGGQQHIHSLENFGDAQGLEDIILASFFAVKKKKK